MNTFTAKDILAQLDQCAKEFTFPMLDNGYIYLADTKLSAYRDDKRWALIIEVVGYFYKQGGHDGIDNCLHIFGNVLDYEPGTNNNNFLYITDNSKEGETFCDNDEEGTYLNPNIKTMLLRNKEINITNEINFYTSKGIELEEPPKILPWEFLRGIVPDNRANFFATELEIRERIPKDLPLILQLNEWHHNDLAKGEKPSDNETFIMLAKVLETGDVKHYTPTKKPNTHWKNWPNGGLC